MNFKKLFLHREEPGNRYQMTIPTSAITAFTLDEIHPGVWSVTISLNNGRDIPVVRADTYDYATQQYNFIYQQLADGISTIDLNLTKIRQETA